MHVFCKSKLSSNSVSVISGVLIFSSLRCLYALSSLCLCCYSFISCADKVAFLSVSMVSFHTRITV